MDLTLNLTVGIIGGGPAGSSCALRLLKNAEERPINIKVNIFEGKEFGTHHNQCVGVLSPPLEEILLKELDLSLPYEIIKRQIFGYRLHSDGNEILLVGEDKTGPTYTVRRGELDRFLLEEAIKRGANFFKTRVTDIEFVNTGRRREVRIYTESGFFKADVVVGAFGLDEAMLGVFERKTPFRRPGKSLKTFITKIYTERRFIERNLGNIIYAFLFPHSIPNIEFGAITPKRDYVIVNIAGKNVNSHDLDTFLELREVVEHLPPFKKEELDYFSGSFPTSPAKNTFGDNYVIVGDATGWLRSFKGKGINTAIITGIKAADTISKRGFSHADFRYYHDECMKLLKDFHAGNSIRLFTKIICRLHLMNPIIELAKVDPILYDALFNAVSGHETFGEIFKKISSPDVMRRTASHLLLWRARRFEKGRGNQWKSKPEG